MTKVTKRVILGVKQAYSQAGISPRARFCLSLLIIGAFWTTFDHLYARIATFDHFYTRIATFAGYRARFWSLRGWSGPGLYYLLLPCLVYTTLPALPCPVYTLLYTACTPAGHVPGLVHHLTPRACAAIPGFPQ